MSDRPYFSIGVTTFKRRELLVETLSSILAQAFVDFEVIVGNDNTAEKLTQEMLGIDDGRVRILNHAENLGEIGNMNELLAQSHGHYFTWLADDDLYTPDFLQAVRDAHEQYGPVNCVFTNYESGTACKRGKIAYADSIERIPGRDFLHIYLDRKIRAIGCYGVFEVEYLRAIGGMERLGSGFSPYSDNLLAIRAGALENLCYIDAPLIFFRTHPGSISFSSPDLDAYLTAQEDLCARALEVFKRPQLQKDIQRNLYQLLSYWCVTFMFHVLRRPEEHRSGYLWDYMKFLRRYSGAIGAYRIRLAATTLRLLVSHWLFCLTRGRAGIA